MSLPTDTSITALCDRLEQLRAEATPGVWKLWGMSVMADQDGTSNVDTAVGVAATTYRDERGAPRTFDAQLICDMHRALPELIAVLRRQAAALHAVEALHDSIDAVQYAEARAIPRKVCIGCGTDDGNWQVWPCPTLRAVRTALAATAGQ